MKPVKTSTLIFCLAAIAFPIIIKDLYFLHMAILIGIYMIIAIGINLLLGYSGQIPLGHAAFFGVGAYVSALLDLKFGISMWWGIVIGAMVAGMFGWIVAKISLKLRGTYFVMMTVGVAEVFKIVSLNWVGLTKGPMGLTNIDAPQITLGVMGTIDFGQKVPYYYLVLFFVILSIFVQHRIVRSSTGRAFISIRENEDLAESVGINCYKYLVMVVVISTIMTGLSGSLYAHYVGFIDPNVFNFFFSVNMLVMVIGGGQGTFSGPIIGAILFTSIPELLRIFGNARMVIYALIVIVIMIFMPRGIPFYIAKVWNMLVKKGAQ